MFESISILFNTSRLITSYHIYDGDNYVNEAPRGRPLLKDAICFGKLFIDSEEYLMRYLSYFPKALPIRLPGDNLEPLWERLYGNVKIFW